jgi:glycopeptide antibiotics resistance protein
MLKMIHNLIISVLPDLLPVIIIITVISCSLRLTYLIKNHKKIIFYKELYSLIFILYILCLFEVVTFQDVNYGTSNFIPFKEIFRYDFGTRLFVKNIVGNILLFLPYGYFVSEYLKSNNARITICLTVLVSTTIEFVQLYIGRTFDIDDIILNTVGGILGYLFYTLMKKLVSILPDAVKNDNVINFIVVIVILIVILYSFNLNIIEWFS